MANLSCAECLSCIDCEICDGCEVECESCESFCETGGQNSRNGFSFGKCVATGQVMTSDNTGFSRTDWNNAINRINSVFRTGAHNASWATISTTGATYMTADEFKRVATAAGYTSDNGKIYSGAIIYGSYFSRLENAVANLKYKWNQCNTCNSSCDGGCNECQSCDSSCNGCNSECGGYCCSCNSCEDTPSKG